MKSKSPKPSDAYYQPFDSAGNKYGETRPTPSNNTTCPYCKGDVDIQPTCYLCGTTGHIEAHDIEPDIVTSGHDIEASKPTDDAEITRRALGHGITWTDKPLPTPTADEVDAMFDEHYANIVLSETTIPQPDKVIEPLQGTMVRYSEDTKDLVDFVVQVSSKLNEVIDYINGAKNNE